MQERLQTLLIDARAKRQGQDAQRKSDNEDSGSDLESVESSPISKINKFQYKLGKINQGKKDFPKD